MIDEIRAPEQLAAPTIETERLRLRSHLCEDLADCVAMWSDPEVTRYTIGAPSPAQRTWARILAYRGHWVLLGFGYWAVVDKASGRYIGELGVADFKRDNQPLMAGVPELGWALATHAHGRGYATEALQAVIAWGDTHLSSRRSVCIIHRDNHRSFRVAEKLGFEEILQNPSDQDPNTILARGSP